MASNLNNISLWDVGVSIGRTNPAPLDSTENQNSISTLLNYAKTGATSYVGQICKVINNGVVDGCYIIKNTDGDLIELVSKDMLSSEISTLSSVFSFKGMAVGIDPDNTTLTIGSTLTITDSSVLPVKDHAGLVCLGYRYDLAHSKYYAWGTHDENGQPSITGYLDTSFPTASTQVYDCSDEISVNCVEYNGVMYYLTSETKDGTINGTITTFTVYSQVDEGLPSIYKTESGDYYSSTVATDSDKITVTDTTYKAYTFSVNTNKTITLASNIQTVEASPANTGNVYQLGEFEYASNGLIWVQLGNPTDEWIYF